MTWTVSAEWLVGRGQHAEMWSGLSADRARHIVGELASGITPPAALVVTDDDPQVLGSVDEIRTVGFRAHQQLDEDGAPTGRPWGDR